MPYAGDIEVLWDCDSDGVYPAVRGALPRHLRTMGIDRGDRTAADHPGRGAAPGAGNGAGMGVAASN